jgi:hypothetical protein
MNRPCPDYYQAKLSKAGDAPVAGSWADHWTAWAQGAQRFNPNHAPAGSPLGGEFASGGGSGGSGKQSAHQAHVAHVAHQAKTGQAALAAANTRRKGQLLAQAKADRAEAHRLQLELHVAQQQTATVTAAHHKAAAAAKAARKAAAHHRVAAHRKASAAHHRLSAHKAHIAHLEHQIHVLLAQATALEAQAARL